MWVIRLGAAREAAHQVLVVVDLRGRGSGDGRVFPGLLERLSNAAGVYYPPATFLIMAVGFLFVIVVHFSWEFSRSDDRIRALAEEIALLRAELEAHEKSTDRTDRQDRPDL